MRPNAFGGDKLDEFDPNYFIANVLEVVENLQGCQVFSCSDCNNTLIVEKGKTPPNFCSLCGKQIDWDNLLDEVKMDICPKCKKKYPTLTVDYCEVDGSELERTN